MYKFGLKAVFGIMKYAIHIHRLTNSWFRNTDYNNEFYFNFIYITKNNIQ